MRCGPIDLVAGCSRQLKWLPNRIWRPPAYEDVMTWKFPAALLATIAVVAIGFGTAPASAQTPATQKPTKQAPRQFDAHGRPYYGSTGPNQSYMQGPHTR